MTQLFAAVDAGGNVRFAGEVPRGIACGCFCPVCASPLVARQGEQLQWHFAHQPGQERPECLVGAINLMHRIGADVLREGGVLKLPEYQEVVRFRHMQEVVKWNAQLDPKSLTWAARPTRSSPVATGTLDTGAKVSIHVLVSQEKPAFPPALGDDDAQVVVWFPMPMAADLRNLACVREHIMRHAHVEWRHHPDVFGLVTAARTRIQKMVLAEANQRTRAAGMRWASIANRMKAGNPPEAPAAPHVRTESPPPAPVEQRSVDAGKPEQPDEPHYEWAPDRKPLSSFIFYRLRDGSSWVVYTRADGSQGIVPWPAFDGWEEFLPPSVATLMPGQASYRATDLIRVLTFFSARSAFTRTGSNPDDFCAP